MDQRVTTKQMVRALMPRSWRLRVRVHRNQGRWEAHARGAFTSFKRYAPSAEEALSGLATDLAEHRLPKVFGDAGWSVIGRETDEISVLIVSSPIEERWAVTIGDPADEGLGRLLGGLADSIETPVRRAIVHPLATRTTGELMDALGVGGAQPDGCADHQHQ